MIDGNMPVAFGHGVHHNREVIAIPYWASTAYIKAAPEFQFDLQFNKLLSSICGFYHDSVPTDMKPPNAGICSGSEIICG